MVIDEDILSSCKGKERILQIKERRSITEDLSLLFLYLIVVMSWNEREDNQSKSQRVNE